MKSWVLQSKLRRVYIELTGVVNVGRESISFDCTNNGFDLKIHGYKGKNLRLTLTNLGGQVSPDKSKFILKKNYVILKLIKPTAQTWGNLIYKKKFDPLKKMDKKEDPQIGMMKMMQRMYEEGDDNMKRTISEAFSKSKEDQMKKGNN